MYKLMAIFDNKQKEQYPQLFEDEETAWNTLNQIMSMTPHPRLMWVVFVGEKHADNS